MIKLLLAVIILSHVAVAQSGTLTIPSALTNNATNISALLPPLDPGNTRWRLTAYSTFDQSLLVTSTFAAPFPASAVLSNDLKLTAGDLVLDQAQRRARIDLACDFGTTQGSIAQVLNVGGTFTANIQDLVGPFTLRHSVRSLVTTSIPFGEGTLVHQTVSRASAIVEYEGRP